jgi:4-amino-4-deoxy-L-arabinose transferase-like glycosyltransferase
MRRAAVLKAAIRARRLAATAGRLLRRIPRAAVVCATVASLNAACWSIVTPPFQVPDEPEHFAYVKQLAEAGQLPTSNSGALSAEELVALTYLHFEAVREQPEHGTISSPVEQAELQHEVARAAHFAPKGSPSAGVATQEPPLYYALQTLPYELDSGGTLLGRLELMRLLSALMGGLTALFVFLFIREALPAVPWAWTVGAFGVALAPLLGFMSGSVNPDALLFAVSAAVFYCLARAFRRGLTRRLALALGAVTAAGLLTKLNFIGLAPGVLLGMFVLAVRAARIYGASAAWRLLAPALALALSPIAAVVAIHLAAGHPLLGVVSSGIDTTRGSLLGELGYIWQLYLPRLPGMSSDFPGLLTARQIWFDGYVGLYGWLDTPFPGWVYDVALVPAGAIALLCVHALLRSRVALRARASELFVYLAMAAGLLVLIGADSYRSFPEVGAEFGQTRYLLPLLPLFGAVLALAARGAGRRWGPVMGAALVVLFFGHDLFSQLQVVARYYG